MSFGVPGTHDQPQVVGRLVAGVTLYLVSVGDPATRLLQCKHELANQVIVAMHGLFRPLGVAYGSHAVAGMIFGLSSLFAMPPAYGRRSHPARPPVPLDRKSVV